MPIDQILDRPDDWTQTFWRRAGIHLADHCFEPSPASTFASRNADACRCSFTTAIASFSEYGEPAGVGVAVGVAVQAYAISGNP